MQNVNLIHHFLIAMPRMEDPYFSRTLTYICEHDDRGAMGIVLNRATEMTLGALYEQIQIPLEALDLAGRTIHFGGPVQMDRGFVLHQPEGSWQSTLPVQDGIALTTSKDILVAVGRGEGPEKMLVTLGYAGWGAGQLEQELAQNAWLTVPATEEVIFDLPADARLQAAMDMLGVNFGSLSEEAGHA